MINNDDSMDKANWPTVFESNLLYLIVLVLMVVSSLVFGVQDIADLNVREFYFRTFVLEVAVIGLPPLLYLLYKRADVSKVIRLNRIKVKEIFLVICMAVFGYGIIIFINYIWIWLISHIGEPIAQPSIPIGTGEHYLVALICIAVVPALVEEFMFRGVILRGYERMGRKVGVIMSGILFALLHMSLVNLPAIILLGIMISYIVQLSDSIITGMIYHFTNNAIAVTLLYASNNIYSSLEDIQPKVPENIDPALVGDVTNMPVETFLSVIIGLGIIMLFSLAMFVLCFRAFKRSTQERTLKGREEIASTFYKARPAEMVPAIIALVIIVIFLALEVFAMIAIG